MDDWAQYIQQMLTVIDRCIRQQEDEALTLRALSAALGYSESYVSRKFRALSGMSLRDYLRFRRLAFALRDVQETQDSLLVIAVRYGFSSHEAFTRAFRAAYGVTPSEYRLHPTAVVLHTILKPFDCYLLGIGGTGMASSTDHIKTYFITIPAHKFLHIRNYESIGYFDFWQKQSQIPGQDCATICGLLSRIPGNLDDFGGDEYDASSGQLMAYINEHYAQPLTLEEIADAFFISKSYLSHEFVRYTNTSVYEYIQFRRICGAKLLIASGVSLTDAAFQSGFNSYSSFLRTFRKTVGISPTDFQRNLGK